MKPSSRHKLTGLLLCVTLLLLPKLAQADSLQGCAVSSAANSLLLVNEGDRQTYDLLGDTTPVKAGQRVKVSGKKKKDTSGKRYFLVGKLERLRRLQGFTGNSLTQRLTSPNQSTPSANLAISSSRYDTCPEQG